MVLPELAVSGYHFSSKEEAAGLSEPADGETAAMLHKAALETGSHYVCGICEQDGEKLYNSAILVGPQGLETCYRKMHLFSREKEFFSASSEGFSLIAVRGIRLGILICFDHMFPEAARTLALAGAQVIAHPSNLVLPEYGQLTGRVRALENRVFWILSNRVGTENRAASALRFTGESRIYGHNGTILAAADSENEQLLLVEADISSAHDKWVTEENNLFQDRRSDFYHL